MTLHIGQIIAPAGADQAIERGAECGGMIEAFGIYPADAVANGQLAEEMIVR